MAYTGSEKVTNDLGEFLVRKYNLQDRRGDIKLQEWDEQWNELEKRNKIY